MDYFMMVPDKRITGTPRLTKAEEAGGGEPEDGDKTASQQSYTFFVEEGLEHAFSYPDYLEKPFPMLHDKLQKIIGKYQRDIIFQRSVLIEKGKNRMEVYHRIQPPELDCLVSCEKKYSSSGEILDVVLNQEKIGGNIVFWVKTMELKLFVRLDAAESMLRRGSNSIWFQPVRLT